MEPLWAALSSPLPLPNTPKSSLLQEPCHPPHWWWCLLLWEHEARGETTSGEVCWAGWGELCPGCRHSKWLSRELCCLLGTAVAVTDVAEDRKVGASAGCRRDYETSSGEGKEQANPSFSHLLLHLLPQQPGTGHPPHWGCAGRVSCCFSSKFVGRRLCGCRKQNQPKKLT